MMRSVLVVDNDPGIVHVVSLWLTRAGMERKAASNGADALAALMARAFELVVTGLVMPRTDGITLIRASGGAGPPARSSRLQAAGGSLRGNSWVSLRQSGLTQPSRSRSSQRNCLLQSRVR